MKSLSRPVCSHLTSGSSMWTVTSVFAVFFVCTAFLFQLVTLSNIRLPLCVRWLILSVYILMGFDFPFVRLFGVR
jgi:hypothetical protein